MSNNPSAATARTHAALLSALGQRSIVFVGLMGAGKSVIGHAVAKRLGLPFADSDSEIEAASRMTVPELFERYGETEFRALERRVILRLLKDGPQVLSFGGGAFMDSGLREALRTEGVSVWLKADLDLLTQRVSTKRNRPLLNGGNPRAVLARLIEERDPIYALADVTVQARDESKEAIVEDALDALVSHLCPTEATDG